MSNRPLFLLPERLSLCAAYVRKGARLIDVGTDHAYLPIWLAKSGKISHAVACDLREGPLAHASENVRKYRVEKWVETRLSDGLLKILPDEADDIVIAGLGGEVIAEIIERAEWLRNPQKRLILQAMTSAEDLRRYLNRRRFAVLEEKAVESDGRVYSVMLVHYSGKPQEMRSWFPYIGRLDKDKSAQSGEYIRREMRHLENRKLGFAKTGRLREARDMEQTLLLLQALLDSREGEEET